MVCFFTRYTVSYTNDRWGKQSAQYCAAKFTKLHFLQTLITLSMLVTICQSCYNNNFVSSFYRDTVYSRMESRISRRNSGVVGLKQHLIACLFPGPCVPRGLSVIGLAGSACLRQPGPLAARRQPCQSNFPILHHVLRD